MPLSFVLITAIAAGSAFLLPTTSRTERMILILALAINIFILFAGLWLAQMRMLEPYWITYLSIAVALVTLILYLFSKQAALAQATENRPQLF